MDTPKRPGRRRLHDKKRSARIQVRLTQQLADKLEAQGGRSRRAREILESWAREDDPPEEAPEPVEAPKYRRVRKRVCEIFEAEIPGCTIHVEETGIGSWSWALFPKPRDLADAYEPRRLRCDGCRSRKQAESDAFAVARALGFAG